MKQVRKKDKLVNGFRLYRQLCRCSGWRAGFTIRRVAYVKYFADAAYGSPEAARKAAEEFASQDSELHRELLALRRRFEVRKTSRSKIPGVSRYGGDDTHGPYWLAYWDDVHGRRVSRRMSIARFGEDRAFELAIKAREEGVRELRRRYEEVLRILGLSADPSPRSRTRRSRRK
jgi:hypothetical protein